MTDIIGEIEAAIVPVRVHQDNRRQTKRYLRSTLKSYVIDGLGNPTSVPVALLAPYNINRHKLFVNTIDFGVIVTLDNPSNSPQADAAATPPAGNSVHVATTGSGFNGYTIYGPDPVWAVAITATAVSRVNVVQYIWCYHE